MPAMYINNESNISHWLDGDVVDTGSGGSDLPDGTESGENETEIFGRMTFFGSRTENETEVWSVPLASAAAAALSSSASLSPLSMSISGTAAALADLDGTSGDFVSPPGFGGIEASLNETSYYWPVRDPLYIVIPLTVIYLMILVTGLLGNVVTCVVIVRSRYLHTATNYYLFSLAISDLLLLLSGLPAEMHILWRRYPDVFGEAFCVCRGLFAEAASSSSVLTIVCFTVERYLAICRPFMIQKWQNKLSRVVRQILIIWIISIGLAIPQALQLGLAPMDVSPGKTAMICTVTTVIIKHSFEISTFVFFVGPMILITALYCLIGFTLRNASRVKESKIRLRKSLSGHKREVGQQRVLKMLVAVVVAFFVCWAPFHAQRLLAIWGTRVLDYDETVKQTYHILTYISGVLYYLSTCINPILYHIMSLKFRHAFQENVNQCCGDKAERKKRREMAANRRSMSHSSRSQALVMTEVTAMAIMNNNGCCLHNGTSKRIAVL